MADESVPVTVHVRPLSSYAQSEHDECLLPLEFPAAAAQLGSNAASSHAARIRLWVYSKHWMEHRVHQ